jgi:hypothetical protein
VSCLLSARETLSAGLIGTGGAVFAGWWPIAQQKKAATVLLRKPSPQSARRL